jgi:hypothetical protein
MLAEAYKAKKELEEQVKTANFHLALVDAFIKEKEGKEGGEEFLNLTKDSI